MNILFVGDIFGSAGRKIVREHIGHVRRRAQRRPASSSTPKTPPAASASRPQIAEDLFDLGADVLTTGNHVWDKRELIDYLESAPADSQAAAPPRAAPRQLAARPARLRRL